MRACAVFRAPRKRDLAVGAEQVSQGERQEMTPATTVRPQILQLPATAPLIRVTAGLGSVGQKTWNLRRPVTLLGARRPAHIVLHDSSVSDAHCVIVNTGDELFLKDLHTDGGTLKNGLQIDLTPLQDGDIIELGETKIQVAIQKPNIADAADWNNAPANEPTRLDPLCVLRLEDCEGRWEIRNPVVLLGSHENASVSLDHADVLRQHAVIFRFCDAPAVFDLGSRSGLHVNDQRCSLTPLHHDDIITAGPFKLRVQRILSEGSASFIEKPNRGELVIEPPHSEPPHGTAQQEEVSAALLSHDLSSSWKGLNRWELDARPCSSEGADGRDSLGAWEEELERKEAALRGKLHDLERFNELIENRERHVNALAVRNKEEAERLVEERIDLNERIAALEKEMAELRRRETAVTQRWSRMKAMRCAQCGTPIQPTQSDSSSLRLN